MEKHDRSSLLILNQFLMIINFEFWVKNFNKLMFEKDPDTTWWNTAAVQAGGVECSGQTVSLRAHSLFIWSQERKTCFMGWTHHTPHICRILWAPSITGWKARAQNTTVYSQCLHHQWAPQSSPERTKFITGEFSCIENDLFLKKIWL